MSTLDKYLLRNNLFYVFLCLGLGVGLYILTDLYDRIDDFLEAGVGLGTILLYFVVKIPLIISQIMPLVFLLGVVLQLSLMGRSRELMALATSGIPYARIIRFFILYGLIWSCLQLAFSQFIGVFGEQKAYTIWKEEVRNKKLSERKLENIWFNDKTYIVKADAVWPHKRQGEGLTVYVLSQDRLKWESIIHAESFSSTASEFGDVTWILNKTKTFDPDGFMVSSEPSLTLPISLDIKSFLAIDPKQDPAQLPLWQLSQVIHRLQASGSNVESLRAAWHMKVAYAFSLAVMALIGLTLVSLKDNIYFNTALSITLAFTYFGLIMFGTAAAEKGLLPPPIGAWAANILFTAATATHLLWHTRTRQ